MAEMGDPRAAVCTEFLQRLAALEPTRDEPTLDENDRYVPSPREVELTTRVLAEDCVVALGPPELRRQLCLTVIREKMSSLAVIVGQRIAEDDYFLDYLRILLAADIRIVPSASSWPREANKCVCLVEPDVLWSLLANGVVSNVEINVLVLRDFEHYLDLGHAYRKIVPCFQKVSGQNKNSSASTWLLALADEMQVCTLDGLESDLERLRTPLKLTCCLATPVRPHAKEAALEVCFLEMDWSAQVGSIVSSSDDPEVQEVGTTLRERGIVAACGLAKKMDVANARAELQEFLAQCQKLMTKLKGDALLDNAQGKTLALTSTVASQRDLRRWLLSRQTVEVAEGLEDVELMPMFVFAATTVDIPTLRQYNWDVVVFCDLPFGVYCDELLENANRAVALATEPQWKKWKEALDLHDDLDRLRLRVNER
ncbi:uncharacterized protein LOC125943680 [Dermacentor silvarum]|uniref:uncharacterized protein LOC125943680 n=1 Tax=Dermacentor silvarum TaxID=543639 RepID=UPI00210169BE|nr:uncharacterized protein LOC125943680 [Dermacentor silvarum]XP_049519092.1 uncharacterized protein LOC125943680 [Dermacentor silvarum]